MSDSDLAPASSRSTADETNATQGSSRYSYFTLADFC